MRCEKSGGNLSDHKCLWRQLPALSGKMNHLRNRTWIWTTAEVRNANSCPLLPWDTFYMNTDLPGQFLAGIRPHKSNENETSSTLISSMHFWMESPSRSCDRQQHCSHPRPCNLTPTAASAHQRASSGVCTFDRQQSGTSMAQQGICSVWGCSFITAQHQHLPISSCCNGQWKGTAKTYAHLLLTGIPCKPFCENITSVVQVWVSSSSSHTLLHSVLLTYP